MARNWIVAPSGGDFNKIQAALDAAQPGDTIAVRGGTYTEKLTFRRGGSAAAGYITLQADPGAVLSGSGITGRDMILIENFSYIKIIGFEIRDNRTPRAGEGSGIRILGSGSYIELRNNRIHEIRGDNAMGITVYGTSSSTSISNLIIDGNEIYDCDPAESEALTLNGNIEQFQVTNNYVHDVNNIGIDFIGGESGFPRPPLVARSGICSRNRVARSRSNYGGGYGAGIYVDGGKDIIIELNTVTESDLGIEIGAENAGLVTSGIIVRNNLVYNNDKAGIVFGGYEAAAGRTKSCQFLNNVCYKNDSKNDGNGQLWIQYAEDNVVRNNIFWAAGNLVLISSESGNVNNRLDYNIWFADPGSNNPEFIWNGLTQFSLAAYQAISHQDAHSLFTDPRFVNATAANFHIQAGSPAIDKGDPTYLPAANVVDIDGNPRLMGQAVDIGAHEFPTATTTSTTTTSSTSTSSTTTTSSTTSTTSSTSFTTTSTAVTRPSTTTTTSTSSTFASSTSTTTASSTTSTTSPGSFVRYFPKIQYSPYPGNVTPNAGLALLNLSSSSADLRFKAYSDTGNLIGEGARTLAPLNQLAAIAFELSPAFNSSATWLSVESNQPSIEGFFLLFDDAVSIMDGTAVAASASRDFLLTVAEDAEIDLVNPSGRQVDYFLEYVSSLGQISGNLQGSIPAFGRTVLPSFLLRPPGASGGYIRGRSAGVVPLEIFGNITWIATLPGIDIQNQAATGASENGEQTGSVNTSYAPQYAFGKGYATVLNIANQETTAASVLLQLFDDNGLPFGVPGTVNLPGSGSARIDSPAIFGLSPGNSLIQGYVKLQSGSRFTGSVLFTDAQRIQFGSALHFVDRTLSTIYFSHVAQNSFYYTGLAAVNPNLQPATVLITVYGSNGVPVAAGSSQIPAGGRFSKVLTELVGAFPAMTRGYFKVASTQPLVAFALFGTHNGTVLSAIPPQYPTGK